jgi:hypothetical protein
MNVPDVSDDSEMVEPSGDETDDAETNDAETNDADGDDADSSSTVGSGSGTAVCSGITVSSGSAVSSDDWSVTEMGIEADDSLGSRTVDSSETVMLCEICEIESLGETDEPDTVLYPLLMLDAPIESERLRLAVSDCGYSSERSVPAYVSSGYTSASRRLMSSEWCDDRNDAVSERLLGDDGRDHIGGGVSGIGIPRGSAGGAAARGTTRGGLGGGRLPPTERSRCAARSSLMGTGGGRSCC